MYVQAVSVNEASHGKQNADNIIKNQVCNYLLMQHDNTVDNMNKGRLIMMRIQLKLTIFNLFNLSIIIIINFIIIIVCCTVIMKTTPKRMFPSAHLHVVGMLGFYFFYYHLLLLQIMIIIITCCTVIMNTHT